MRIWRNKISGHRTSSPPYTHQYRIAMSRLLHGSEQIVGKPELCRIFALTSGLPVIQKVPDGIATLKLDLTDISYSYNGSAECAISVGPCFWGLG